MNPLNCVTLRCCSVLWHMLEAFVVSNTPTKITTERRAYKPLIIPSITDSYTGMEVLRLTASWVRFSFRCGWTHEIHTPDTGTDHSLIKHHCTPQHTTTPPSYLSYMFTEGTIKRPVPCCVQNFASINRSLL